MAVLTAYFVGILLGRRVIRAIYQLNFRDRASDFGDMSPRSKDGTPTMGGLIIFFSLLVSVLLWGSWKKPNNFFLGTIIFTAFWFTALGFFDDYLKNIRGASDLGMNRGLKLFLQALFGVILALLLLAADASPFAPEIATKLFVPFLKNAAARSGHLLLPLHRAGHHRHRQLHQFRRRPRRPGHRPGRPAGRRIRRVRLHRRQLRGGRIPVVPVHQRLGRAGGGAGGPDRRPGRLSVVQHLPGRNVHGRHRLAAASAASSPPRPCCSSTSCCS